MNIWLPTIRTGTGTDIFSKRLSDALNKRGIQCELSWFSQAFEFAPFLLQTVTPPAGTSLVHANSWNGFAFARKNIPLVVTEHLNVHDQAYTPFKSTLQSIYHKNFIKRYEARSFRAAKRITCVSNYTCNTTRKSFGLDGLEVITTWVDTNTFQPRREPARNKGTLDLLFVGNPTRRKGWDLVVEIMGRLGPRYRLMLAGNSQGMDSNLPENIVPLGVIHSTTRLVELYNECDALLFPSRLEGLSQVVLEAMSCGLPVITSNSCSMPEIISHGIDGFLCPADDPGEFIRVIRDLDDHRHRLGEISGNARARICDHYSEDIVIEKYISIYRALG